LDPEGVACAVWACRGMHSDVKLGLFLNWLYYVHVGILIENKKIVDERINKATGEYELMSIISHIGRNTDHGHYVCHRKLPTGEWALFNDEKVAQSGKPPLEHGFMYLFRKSLTLT